MARWQRTIRLQPEWSAAQEGTLSIPMLAHVVVTRLKAVASLGEDLDRERAELVEEFEAIAADETATQRDFDDVLHRLYDWGDTPLDDKWNGKKACWIDTISGRCVMDLARLMLAASAIDCGMAKIRAGQVDAGLSLIAKGFACLQGLLSDVERKQGEAA